MPQQQTKPITIVVNGQERAAPPDANISSLLRVLGIEGARVAVELNRAIVRKSDWDATPVPDGSVLEIVQFVGGG